MCGQSFEALKKACFSMGETIFGENPDDNVFDNTHLVFYDNKLSPTEHKNYMQYLQVVESERVGNSTDFVICFNYLKKEMEKFCDGTNVQIIFLTDGQDNQNGGKLQ